MAVDEPLSAAIAAMRASHPKAKTVEVFSVGLNGVPRGKRVPLEAVDRLAREGPGGVRFQPSLAGLDIFGLDVPASGIAMETGDPDGAFVPLAHTLGPASFCERPLLVLQGMLADASGSPLSAYDPRAVLLDVLEKARAMGFRPVVALELEFYLIDPVKAAPARHPTQGTRLDAFQMMDLDLTEAFDPILSAVCEAAAAQGIVTETVLAEFGAGQFEINLRHRDDAARACDEMVALKRLIRAAARAKGLDATFMAKPFGAFSGSGLHIHLSLLDQTGRNVFDEPGEPVGRQLQAAIAGLAETTGDTFLVFAPHLNSYRRFLEGSYAPMSCTWGLDNRGAAIRVPKCRGPDARLEHRIAGADANPYLVTAAVIAAVLDGIANSRTPGPISQTDVGEGPEFPGTWREAIERFAGSIFAEQAFGPETRHVFSSMKRQEEAVLRQRVTDVEYEIYLRNT
ncbi:MAG: glutamine synthetase family protein [Pseudomonadota bacterium]